MFKFGTNILCTIWQKFCEGLHWVSVRNTFYQLMDGSDGVGANIRACIIEDHVEDHLVERF